MADPSEQPTFSPGLKRTHDGQVVLPSTQTTHLVPQQTQVPQLQRAQSPALSTTSSSLTDLSSIAPPNPITGISGSPAKKRKLTFAEKQVKKTEQERLKAERARQKAEEQVKKDEEKRLKDEEKRRKAEEKEAEKKVKEVEKAEREAVRVEKQKLKDAEKAEKEAQKAEKEAEKLKKERAQMRLGAFFGRPAITSSPPSTPDDVSSGVSSRRSSITSIDMERPELDAKTAKPTNSEFTSWILPFFPHEHTDVAPYNRFLNTHDATGLVIEWLDNPDQALETDLESLKQLLGTAKSRNKHIMPVETIINKLSGTEQRPVDLTGGSEPDSIVKLLENASYKILSFREDVRPPYQGTFTHVVSPKTSRKLRRNPAYRGIPKVDYDYDSEAEWEAPEAGDEDLEDDDEMSDEDEAIDDMADFLDDEEEIARRRVTTSDAEPECTGLCWEGEVNRKVASIDLATYRMDVLSDDTRLPIDPYSTTHWSQTGKATPAKNKGQSTATLESTTPVMQPPRLPLLAVSAPNSSPLKKFVTGSSNLNKENEAPLGQKKDGQNPKKATKRISPDLLPAFKAAVSGSDLNKVALIEILKKQFPKCPKDAIKGTLETIAVRQGVKEVDKRWVLFV